MQFLHKALTDARTLIFASQILIKIYFARNTIRAFVKSYGVNVKFDSDIENEIANIENGDNIEVKAQFDFYKGDLSLTINWAKKLNNIGDLHSTFELLKEEFTKQGYFNKKIQSLKSIQSIN